MPTPDARHPQPTLDPSAIRELRTRLRGRALDSTDSVYDNARQTQNGLIDRRPALIARCSGTADVVEVVNFAREQRPSAVDPRRRPQRRRQCHERRRAGDRPFRHARRPRRSANRTVRAAGGATWGDVDRETQLFGLAVPGGVVSTTGIAGLTLHGGYGHLRRKYGLSIDNLLSVEIVTADGQVRTASATENADLFWAVRGAGSNFGVVTSFEFRAHPVGPIVQLCAPFYALDDGRTVLRAWREFTATAARRASVRWRLCGACPTSTRFPRSSGGGRW